jgi:hypothetical protein
MVFLELLIKQPEFAHIAAENPSVGQKKAESITQS